MFVYAAIVLVAAWIYAAVDILADRRQTLAVARGELSVFASGLNVHTEAILADGLGTGRAAANHLASIGGVDGAAVRDALSLLRGDLVSGVYVDAVFVASRNRLLVAGRDGYREAAEGVPSWLQDAFDRMPELFVGPSIGYPHQPERREIPIATKVLGEGGSVVYAGAWIGIEALHQRYASFLPQDTVMGLVAEDGEILARVSSGTLNLRSEAMPRVGSMEVHRKLMSSARARPSIVEARGPTGLDMMYAVSQPEPAIAILTVVGRTQQSIMAPWYARMLKKLAVAGVSSAMLLLLTLVLQHYVGELNRAQKALEQVNEMLEKRVAERTLELKQSNARLAAANEELEAFSAAASHDLRSPLTTISGQAGLLELKLDDTASPEVHERLDRIHAAVRRAVEVIEGMLSLARISRHELRREEVSLSALVRQCVDEISERERSREVDCRIQPEMRVIADPRLMKSLLSNLISNAWKYSVRTQRVEIDFTCEQGPLGPAYCVKDHGIGFDMAHAGHLFQPFRRLHSVSEFPGTGVGLAIVARIVHRYGGEAWARGEVGRGAAFCFTLPLAQYHRQEELQA